MTPGRGLGLRLGRIWVEGYRRGLVVGSGARGLFH
jgi:hypothetical protein